MDVSEELANRICSRLNYFFNYKQFCDLLKTRELTQTRINRALLHIMLGIKKTDVEEYIDGGYHFYARLLGFTERPGKTAHTHLQKKVHCRFLSGCLKPKPSLL